MTDEERNTVKTFISSLRSEYLGGLQIMGIDDDKDLSRDEIASRIKAGNDLSSYPTTAPVYVAGQEVRKAVASGLVPEEDAAPFGPLSRGFQTILTGRSIDELTGGEAEAVEAVFRKVCGGSMDYAECVRDIRGGYSNWDYLSKTYLEANENARNENGCGLSLSVSPECDDLRVKKDAVLSLSPTAAAADFLTSELTSIYSDEETRGGMSNFVPPKKAIEGGNAAVASGAKDDKVMSYFIESVGEISTADANWYINRLTAKGIVSPDDTELISSLSSAMRKIIVNGRFEELKGDEREAMRSLFKEAFHEDVDYDPAVAAIRKFFLPYIMPGDPKNVAALRGARDPDVLGMLVNYIIERESK